MQSWDIFCAVVDHYGDIGVCWRLARQLADEFDARVRLWVDDLESFSRLCSSVSCDAARQQIGSIEVAHWSSDFPEVDAADVVIEAFACEIPSVYVAAMSCRTIPPIWINLEYLTAEGWVDGCHLLQSPQAGTRLTKYFFFPGFTTRTGGLIRERNLMAMRSAFGAKEIVDFRHRLGIPAGTEAELCVSLFCYDNAALPELLQCWSEGPMPVRVFAAPGAATNQVTDWFGQTVAEVPLFRQGQPILTAGPFQRGCLTVHLLPFLPQSEYDHLLWACDINMVRGEDSFVRAQWARQPFIWQIYPQAGNAHIVKLTAFADRYLESFDDADVVRHCFEAWNGAGNIGSAWRDFAAKRVSIGLHGNLWARQLDRTSDLANNLVRFVSGD